MLHNFSLYLSLFQLFPFLPEYYRIQNKFFCKVRVRPCKSARTKMMEHMMQSLWRIYCMPSLCPSVMTNYNAIFTSHGGLVAEIICHQSFPFIPKVCTDYNLDIFLYHEIVPSALSALFTASPAECVTMSTMALAILSMLTIRKWFPSRNLPKDSLMPDS